jgi:hypothetical protein
MAQNGDNNIYTRFGLGVLETEGNPIQMGMGGTGVANANMQAVNFINPASLSNLPITTFQASGALKQSAYSFQNNSTQVLTGYLKEVALGFRKPGSKFGFGIGLQPYSFVNYESSATIIESDSLLTTYTYKGKGGMNKATMGGSRKFFLGKDTLNSGPKHILAIGINLNYLFGTIDHSSNTSFGEQDNYEQAKYSQNHFLNGFQPDIGLMYTLPFRQIKDVNQKIIRRQELTAGITWGINSKLKSKSIYIEELVFATGVTDTTSIDENVKFDFNLPQHLRVGLAWNLYHNKLGDLSITAEFKTQDWSASQLNLALDLSDKNKLGSSEQILLGLAFTPENSVHTSTFRHCTYRMGFNQGHSYHQINALQLKQTAYTAGISIPILKSLNKVHLGAAYTTSGLNDAALLQAKGMFYQIGFTLVPREPWFFQRKYD